MKRPAKHRFDHYEADPADVKPLRPDHAAMTEMRTIFTSTVVDADQSPRLLVSGANQRKIGDRVTVGKWAGMPIYCLTLEERATCPASCHMLDSCYGNGMHMSRRHRHGPKLEYLLPIELADLQSGHHGGFVIRLHVLGDFVDVAYVALWDRWLQEFPALHVFGYTAHPRSSGIGRLVHLLNIGMSDRWQVRFSVPEVDGSPLQATTLWEKQVGPSVSQVIVCPAQTGARSCCGDCGLCWATDRPIGFIAHGNPHPGRPKGSARDVSP